MAKNIVDIAGPSKTTPADANYPEGSAKDVSAPGAADGTPLLADWVNQREAIYQAVMVDAGFVWDGTVDTAISSQIYDAQLAVFRDGDANPNSMKVGTAATVVTGQGFNSNAQVNGTDGQSGSLSLLRCSADTTGFNVSLNKSRSPTVNGFGIVQAGDGLGNILWSGDTGDDYSNPAAQISATVVTTPTMSDLVVEADLEFKQIVGAGITTNWIMDQATRALLPNTDGVQDLGSASNRCDQIWAAIGTIQTSDGTMKNQLGDLLDPNNAEGVALLDALQPLTAQMWQWNTSVAEKGPDGARIHVGPITQTAKQLCDDAGIDITKYGFWCSDMVPAEYIDEPIMEMRQTTKVVEKTETYVELVDGTPVQQTRTFETREPVFEEMQVKNEFDQPLWLDKQGNSTTVKTERAFTVQVPVMEERQVEIRRVPKTDENGEVITVERQGFRYDQLAQLMIACLQRRVQLLEDTVNV